MHNFFNNKNVTPPVQNVQKQDVLVAQVYFLTIGGPVRSYCYSESSINSEQEKPTLNKIFF